MKLWCWLPLLIFSSTVFAAPTDNTQKTASYFASLANHPNQQTLFLRTMPKGGDLHNHLAGATYAEDLLQYAKNDPLCFDPKTLAVNPSQTTHCQMRIAQVFDHPHMYQDTIDAWSMRNFIPTEDNTGYDHFFDTFSKLFPLVGRHNSEILAEEMQRAAQNNNHYLEIMVSGYDLNMPATAKGDLADAIGDKIAWDANPSDWPKLQSKYLKAGIPAIAKTTIDRINVMDQGARKILQCDSNQPQPGCQVKVRYQYYVFRDLPRKEFFPDMLLAFYIANTDSKVVGVNIVRAEDAYLSLKNDEIGMQLIGYLHQAYPNVNIDLHAGEFNPKQVPPEYLRSHIRLAVEVAHANRIGHGVDIAHETNSSQLLQEMAQKPVPVEICLTSNATLLGVKGKDHPLPLYLAYHVPVVLGTDDEGELRTDISREFERAAVTYHLSYLQLKQMARNSMTYSFLPGANLWQNTQQDIVVSACANQILGSTQNANSDCGKFLANSEKARGQWQLEHDFNQFEQSMAAQQLRTE